MPAATAPLRLAPDLVEEYGDRPVTLATVLPMAWPAMTKPDGRVFIGLQRHLQSGDVSPGPGRGAALRAGRPSRAGR